VSETPLGALMRRHIERDGPLDVATWMALCLGHPRHGYYATRDPLGARGDFTTAPEISALFGLAIGAQLAFVWDASGRPAPLRLVELGPGRGTLMADIARVFDLLAPASPIGAAASFHLVETSPVLRAKQEAALVGRNAAWHTTLDAVPEDGTTYLVANEFFDALPIRQFVRERGQWRERRIAWHGDERRFVFVGGGAALPEGAPGLPRAAEDGAVVEAAPARTALAAEIGRRAAARMGFALVVDYGYVGPPRGSTLRAMAAHANRLDPLEAPGERDLSADVDFAGLVRALEGGGAAVSGPLDQSALLAEWRIDTLVEGFGARLGRRRLATLEAERDRLVAPEGMGRVYKAVVASDPRMGYDLGRARSSR
jgi:SAM-dependent MidA family methyltransferase